jgi:leucyl-tRNA synthetase
VVLMLSPIAPHICQQLWQDLGYSGLVAEQVWPSCDDSALARDEIEMVVQVNGKLRSRIMIAIDATNDSIETAARADEKVIQHLEGKTVRKVIVVPGRLVNIVAT